MLREDGRVTIDDAEIRLRIFCRRWAREILLDVGFSDFGVKPVFIVSSALLRALKYGIPERHACIEFDLSDLRNVDHAGDED